MTKQVKGNKFVLVDEPRAFKVIKPGKPKDAIKEAASDKKKNDATGQRTN